MTAAAASPVAADRLQVVVAPDKFKGTLSGAQAAAAMSAGVCRALPGADVRVLPLADGGEGTVAAVLEAGGWDRHTCTVPGPLGDPVEAHFAVSGGTAVLEAAQACGLALVEPSPETALRAGSAGVGVLVRAAWEAGATEIVLGLGGVACTDGGVGLAGELGVLFLDAAGGPVGPGELHRVATVRVDGLDPRAAHSRFVAATDVTNPLLGRGGAAAVYGPQKGAGPQEVAVLERGLTRLAEVAGGGAADETGAGAAGGLGWGLMTFLGATVRSGSTLVLDLVGLPAALDGADLVVTGEGSLDAQSRYGKGPVSLAALAAESGVPTIAIAGAVEPAGREGTGFAAVWSLVEELGADAALTDTAASLTTVTERAVRHQFS